MPVRVGFTQYRREMLERELQRVQDLLPSLGVEKVILTGDMATGDYAPDSRIELIIVQKTELPKRYWPASPKRRPNSKRWGNSSSRPKNSAAR